MAAVLGILFILVCFVLCGYISAKAEKTRQERADKHLKKVLFEAFEEYDKKTSPFFFDEDEDEK